ncbi:MAG TPA: glycogen synthase GlgA [Blastocatellia bacterium]|nr:glycogen synthase GlgA [Blastocatellia bacterium]
MNILLAASEVVPYAKTGGLADVAAALPKALSRLGHSVRVVMPRYHIDSILSRGVRLPGQLRVPFDFALRTSDVYVDRSGEVPVYFIDAPEYFGSGKLYGERNDAERFAFFSRATIEFAKGLGERFDILHLNDWMTGLVPVYLKTVYGNDPAFAGTRTLFTIHNMAFQGLFGEAMLPQFGLPEWLYRTEGGLEFYGAASALKGALIFADGLSTVSPRYSQEIQTPEFGGKMDGLLRSRRQDLYGILNGVDYDEWNPEIDPLIAARYSVNDLSGKAECKRDVLRQFGLPEEMDRPLVACISRLSDQKGFDLIFDSIERMLNRGITFILLGSGADVYERGFQALRSARPSQVGVFLDLSNELAHKIEAGADIFLMPSRFEPCGLNQMYSLKYGTAPIVRATGGLDDTIENFDRATRVGNGFKFYEYDSTRLLEKFYEAIMVYADRELWRALMINGMRADYSWDSSARHYIEVYERLARRGVSVAV